MNSSTEGIRAPVQVHFKKRLCNLVSPVAWDQVSIRLRRCEGLLYKSASSVLEHMICVYHAIAIQERHV